jgi:hypothetical protein
MKQALYLLGVLSLLSLGFADEATLSADGKVRKPLSRDEVLEMTGQVPPQEDKPARKQASMNPDDWPPLPSPSQATDPFQNATAYVSLSHPQAPYVIGFTQQCPFLFRKEFLERAATTHALMVSGGSRKTEAKATQDLRMEALHEASFVCNRMQDACAQVAIAKERHSAEGSAPPLAQEQQQTGYNFTCTASCLHMARLFTADMPKAAKEKMDHAWPEDSRPPPPDGAVVVDPSITPVSECTKGLAPYLFNRTHPGATAVLAADRATLNAAGMPEDSPIDDDFLQGQAHAEVKFSGGLTSTQVAQQLCVLPIPGAGGKSLADSVGKGRCMEAMRRQTHGKRAEALRNNGGVADSLGVGWAPAVRQFAYLARKMDAWLEANMASGGDTHIAMFPHKVDFILRFMHGVTSGALLLPRQEGLPHRDHIHVCQTGLGAGHSAIAFLLNNPKVYVTSFDSAALGSVRQASSLLDQWFDGRHATVPGHSRQTLPQYVARQQGMQNNATQFEARVPPHLSPCDIVFLDASSSRATVAHDLKWFAAAASQGAIVMLNEHSGEDSEVLARLGMRSPARGHLGQDEEAILKASGGDVFTGKHYQGPEGRHLKQDAEGRAEAWKDAVNAGVLVPRAYITGPSEEDDENDRGCVRTIRATLRPLFGAGGEAVVRAATEEACSLWVELPSSANTTKANAHHGDNYAWVLQDALAEALYAVAPLVTHVDKSDMGAGRVLAVPGERQLQAAQLAKWGRTTPLMFRAVGDPAEAAPHDIAVGTYASTAHHKNLPLAGQYFFAHEDGLVDVVGGAYRMQDANAASAAAASKGAHGRRRRRKPKK